MKQNQRIPLKPTDWRMPNSILLFAPTLKLPVTSVLGLPHIVYVRIENSHPCPWNPYRWMIKHFFLFSQDTLEACSKEQEFKSILFSLCYFHACVAGRLRFGPQGWSRSYPFSPGDLTICAHVLYNYLEANPHVSASGQITSCKECTEAVSLWALTKWTTIS